MALVGLFINGSPLSVHLSGDRDSLAIAGACEQVSGCPILTLEAFSRRYLDVYISYISMNWRGRPLISHEVIVNLIAATTTRKGLKVRAGIDRTVYPTGVKVSDKDFAAIRLIRHEFHGEWNYTVAPNTS